MALCNQTCAAVNPHACALVQALLTAQWPAALDHHVNCCIKLGIGQEGEILHMLHNDMYGCQGAFEKKALTQKASCPWILPQPGMHACFDLAKADSLLACRWNS